MFPNIFFGGRALLKINCFVYNALKKKDSGDRDIIKNALPLINEPSDAYL